MADFTMTKYRNQYIEGCTKLGNLGRHIESMKGSLIYSDNPAAMQAEIETAETEYQALAIEVDDLKCLADTGRHRAELNQASGIQWRQQAGGWKPHFPENSIRRLNH